MLTWVVIDVCRGKKVGLINLCVGCIAGLASITPGAGFVEPYAAFLIGIICTSCCYAAVEILNSRVDDSLDVVGVHGVGGFTGTVLVGAFANQEGLESSLTQFGRQLGAALFCSAHSLIITYLILYLIDKFMTIRPTLEELKHLDSLLHGEFAYSDMFNQIKEQYGRSDLLEPLTMASIKAETQNITPEKRDALKKLSNQFQQHSSKLAELSSLFEAILDPVEDGGNLVGLKEVDQLQMLLDPIK